MFMWVLYQLLAPTWCQMGLSVSRLMARGPAWPTTRAMLGQGAWHVRHGWARHDKRHGMTWHGIFNIFSVNIKNILFDFFIIQKSYKDFEGILVGKYPNRIYPNDSSFNGVSRIWQKHLNLSHTLLCVYLLIFLM